MEDREVVAAIGAGDPSGLAAAYDRYAAAIYGYCRWMLREPAASDAVRHTFAVAAAELGGVRDDVGLRPWLYSVAREECYHRLRADGAGVGNFGADGLTQAAGALGQAAGALGQAAGARARAAGADHQERAAQRGDAAEQAELRGLIRAALAGLKPHEREIIELSLRHDLDDGELSAVLGVSWSRAHALASHARGQLERALAALLIARTGRTDCRALDRMLAGWDGRLTVRVADIVARHVEQCPACAGHTHGGLRPEVLPGLLPLAASPEGLRESMLPEGLRESVLPEGLRESVPNEAGKGADGEPDRVQRRGRLGVSWLPGFPGWGRIRHNPGGATAVTAVVVWVAAAASVTVLTVTGTHAVRALAAQPGPAASASSPAPAGSGTSAGTATGRPRTHRHRRAPVRTGPTAPLAQPSATASPAGTATSSPSQSAAPSTSPSASASKSASQSPSASPTPSRTPTHSPSPSPSPSASPSPSPSPSP
jgi:RNA polymerase sigma factor (sigma-70 family)